jgi:hypothetical protein
MAVKYFQLDVRPGHQVIQLEEQQNGWLVHYKNKEPLKPRPRDK